MRDPLSTRIPAARLVPPPLPSDPLERSSNYTLGYIQGYLDALAFVEVRNSEKLREIREASLSLPTGLLGGPTRYHHALSGAVDGIQQISAQVRKEYKRVMRTRKRG